MSRLTTWLRLHILYPITRWIMYPKLKQLLNDHGADLALFLSGTVGPGFDKVGFDPVKAGETVGKIASQLNGLTLSPAPTGDEKARVDGASRFLKGAYEVFGIAAADQPVINNVLSALATDLIARKPPAGTPAS